MFYYGKVSGGASRSHEAKPKSTTATEPKTPGADDATTDFVALKDKQSSTVPAADVDAKSYFDALRTGFFLNTNSWSGFCYRTANTGIAPRQVLLLEFLLIFVMTPYLELSRMLSDRHLKRAGSVGSKPVSYATFETTS